MEIYKDLSNPASKEFEKLLNNQFTKNTIEEGKIVDGKINKITVIACIRDSQSAFLRMESPFSPRDW